MLFLDNQQQILHSIVRQISGEFLLDLQDEEDFIKETVSTRIDLLSKLEQSLKQSVGTIGAISSRKTTDSSTRSAGSLADKSIGSVEKVNDKKESRPEATKKEDIGDDKQEIKSKIEPVAGKKERSVPKLSKAPSDFVPLASANPIQQSLAELRKGIAAANVKKSQYRITNSIAINDIIPRESNSRISTMGTNVNRQSMQKDDSLDSLPGDETIQDLVDMSINLDQESIVLDTPRQLATTSTSSNTTKVLNTPTQTKQIQNFQLHSNTPKKVFQGTPLKNEIIPKADSPTTVKKAAPEFKKPIPVSQDGFKSPFKSPPNLYKGQATSFLAPSAQLQDSIEDKPLYSFLQGVTKKPIVKPKIEVKSLQLAQAAAKRERLEKERKQKLKEERELKTKKMMEIRKQGEMKPIESKKPDFKKVELKSTVEASKKPELVGIKRTAETQLAAPKKLLKLQSPTKIVKKV